jgi:hypothetical protein
MRESVIEKHLVRLVTLYGGEVRKLKWIGRANAMDRFVALNGVWLVELKAPGEKERIGQVRERERLTKQGVRCRVADSIEAVEQLMKEILHAPS